MVLKSTFLHIYVDVRRLRLLDVGLRLKSFVNVSGFKRIIPTGEPIFVIASHQIGLDTRSITRRLTVVGIYGKGRSEPSQGTSPAGLCWSSAHLVQCGSDEPC